MRLTLWDFPFFFCLFHLPFSLGDKVQSKFHEVFFFFCNKLGTMILKVLKSLQFQLLRYILCYIVQEPTNLRKEISILWPWEPNTDIKPKWCNKALFLHILFFCQNSDNKKKSQPNPKNIKLYKKWYIFPLFIYRIVFLNGTFVCTLYAQSEHNAPRIISARNFCFITNRKSLFFF